jgi:hypothetical protein
MFQYKTITEADKIRNLSNRVIGHEILPPYLLSEDIYMKIVICMEEENVPIGLTYGVIVLDSNVFFLHFLFIKKEYRSRLTILSLLEASFRAAINARGVKKAVWKYFLDKDETDSRLELLRDIPFCRVKKLQTARQFRVKTADFNFIRNYKIYKPSLWKTKGYNVLPWSDCTEGLISRIREIEQSAVSKNDYQSPFNIIDNYGYEYDAHNSYILVKGETDEPMGWIMCSIVSDEELMIRNFYMYPHARTFMIAHSFATYVLDVIALAFNYLAFNIVDGNRQMEMIAKKYFEPILESSNIQCCAFVDLLH